MKISNMVLKNIMMTMPDRRCVCGGREGEGVGGGGGSGRRLLKEGEKSINILTQNENDNFKVFGSFVQF